MTAHARARPGARRSAGDQAFDILLYVLFGLFTVTCIFPFYYIFINTISDNNLVATGRIRLIPQGIHLENYLNVLKLDTIVPATMVSAGRTVVGTIVTVLAAAFPGYAFSREEYWHRKLFYRFCVVTMYFSAGLIPLFLTYKLLGIYNTFWVYILPYMVTPYNLILCKTYMESLPASLEESAEIDGAGYLTRFIRIILPLSKPILATIAVFSAVGQWNNFTDTVFFIQNTNRLQTLQYVLYDYLNRANAVMEIMRTDPSQMEQGISTMLTPLTVKYTICVVTVLPILIVYPFFQRFFVKGIMIGAVKG